MPCRTRADARAARSDTAPVELAVLAEDSRRVPAQHDAADLPHRLTTDRIRHGK